MKTIIKSKNKRALTTLSLAMSVLLLGTINSPSLFAAQSESREQHQTVEISIESDGKNEVADIVMNIDGEIIKIQLPKSVLKNKQALADALSDVPENIRENLINTLSAAHDNTTELHRVHEQNNESDHQWMSKSGEKVIIIDIDDSDGKKHIIKQMMHGEEGSNAFFFSDEAGMSADMIIRLIKGANFSNEDLDNIQQVIDAKR